jgi:hypothetical protein
LIKILKLNYLYLINEPYTYFYYKKYSKIKMNDFS